MKIPDVTWASDRFEILTDDKLMIPFHRVKGLSENAARAIVEARGRVPFKSMADFVARVPGRLVNKAKVAILEKIGAFAAIEPAHLPSDSPTRIKDQRELIPGLITSVVPIHREIQLEEMHTRTLGKLHKIMSEKMKADGIPVRPFVGKNASFVIVFDAPSAEEEKENMMFMSSPSRRPFAIERVQEAMDEAGFRVDDAYWTALIKRPKEGKQVSASEIKLYKPFFDKELDIIKSPVIVLMGSTTVRAFLPDFKGKASDDAGAVVYDAGLDANLVVGFAPGEIWHDTTKQTALNKVFDVVKGLVA